MIKNTTEAIDFIQDRIAELEKINGEQEADLNRIEDNNIVLVEKNNDLEENIAMAKDRIEELESDNASMVEQILKLEKMLGQE